MAFFRLQDGFRVLQPSGTLHLLSVQGVHALFQVSMLHGRFEFPEQESRV